MDRTGLKSSVNPKSEHKCVTLRRASCTVNRAEPSIQACRINGAIGRKRTASIDVNTFRATHRAHELRERKVPERFEPENFVEKKRQRRLSIAIAHKHQFSKRQEQSTNLNLKGLQLAIQKIISISSIQNDRLLPQNKCIEDARYVLSRFPDNITALNGEARLLLLKFDEEAGILYVQPKTKRSVREVESGCDLVLLIITGTLKVTLLNVKGESAEQIMLPVFTYMKIEAGTKYELENDCDKPALTFFRLNRRWVVQDLV